MTPRIFTSHLGPPIRHSATPIHPPWAQKTTPLRVNYTHTHSANQVLSNIHTLLMPINSTLKCIAEVCVYSKCILIWAFRSCCNQEAWSREAGSGWQSDSDASEPSAQLEINAHLRRGRVNHPSRPACRAPPDTAYLPSNKSAVQLESAARVSGCVSRWQNRLSCQSSCSEGRLITNTNNNVPAITINMLMTVINTAANGSAGITETAKREGTRVSHLFTDRSDKPTARSLNKSTHP